MSDQGLSQAVDLLTLCLGDQSGSAAGSFANLVYSEDLKVWAVVDVRECEGECPVRERVAQAAGNQFGRILSDHLRLELALLSIACHATDSEPRELLRQVLVEAGVPQRRQSGDEAPDDQGTDDEDPDDRSPGDQVPGHQVPNDRVLDDPFLGRDVLDPAVPLEHLDRIYGTDAGNGHPRLDRGGQWSSGETPAHALDGELVDDDAFDDDLADPDTFEKDDKEPDRGHVSARYRMMLDRGEPRSG